MLVRGLKKKITDSATAKELFRGWYMVTLLLVKIPLVIWLQFGTALNDYFYPGTKFFVLATVLIMDAFCAHVISEIFLDTEVKTGDRVKIKVSRAADAGKQVSRKKLDLVTSKKARTYLKRVLRGRE